jgi:outer membrane protein TolC
MKHRLIKPVVAIISTFISLSCVWAQDVRPLPLADAINMSLQNSGKLKIADAKVEEALAMLRESRNNRLPDIKATGSYLRLNAPDINLKINTSSAQPGEENTGNSTPKVDQAAYALVNASVPLFAGFRVKYGIESAKYLEQAARLDVEKDKEEVIQNVISAYSNLYKAHKSVALVKENMEREQQRVVDFTNMERNGIMARNDLLKAQLQLSNIELSLLDAENNLNIANVNMNLMLGLPVNTVLRPDSTGFEVAPLPGTINDWVEKALTNRKDRAALALRIQAAGTAVKATTGAYYPSLALTGGYVAANIPNLLTLTNALNLGIGLQYDLASLYKTSAKVDAAKARLHQAQAADGILADQVRLEVYNSYQNYIVSVRKVDVYKKSVEQANENYRITKNKYDNSLVTTTELLDADVAQLQAKLNYAFSKADAAVAYKKLEQTAGTLKQ